MLPSFRSRLTRTCLALSVISVSHPQSKPAASAAASAFSREVLNYSVEWRLIFAGNARLSMEPSGSPEQGLLKVRLHLQSGGLISKLYRVDDNYEAEMDDHFCANRTTLDAMERSRHHETNVEYDRARGKASYVERDLLKNTVIKTAETEIPPCVNDIIGGLYKLRTLRLEPGQSDQLIISDGKKTASARVDAQARETVKTNAGTFNTVRYEAHIFNGVLYARKAQFLMWVTDDARRLPVQFRARMSFPIGSITLQLDKEEHP